jgi:pimeloyl-ACP methyl ester carboxylesterase
MGRTIELKTGINMAYAELGNEPGQTVVMIHGATDSRVSFSQIAVKLADEGCHVYLPELRGHGESEKPDEKYTIPLLTKDIEAFMDGLGIGAAHIVGHSLGSFIAQELAITRPDLVLKLTLIGSSNKLAGNDTLRWLLDGDSDFPGVMSLNGEMPDEFIVEWTSSTNEDTAFIEATYNHAKNLPAATWVNMFSGVENWDNTERLSEVTTSAQVIWGTNDTFFDKRDQMLLVNSLGSKHILYLPKVGKGHNTHWEKDMAAEITEDILRFLRV